MLKKNALSILSTIPRSGTWFLRYSISFFCHLEAGGRIDDRITGSVIGNPTGLPFDFQRFKGGPLFRVRGTLPADHLFIGHTVCPGFADLAGGVDWWGRTGFHVPGYDYLHEGMNYKYTPVELARYDYTPVRVPALERAARKGFGSRMVLVYRNPIDQAASYFRYCQAHKDPTYSTFRGRPLTSVPFRDYLFESGLPSYARLFISFQAMAARYPALVRLIPYETMIRRPVDILTTVLDHLAGAPRDWPMLEDAVHLARREHLKAIETELGRSLDGTRSGIGGSHIRQRTAGSADHWIDDTTRGEAIALLQGLGLDTDLFEWPTATETASAA
jgi:hypothetical protein